MEDPSKLETLLKNYATSLHKLSEFHFLTNLPSLSAETLGDIAEKEFALGVKLRKLSQKEMKPLKVIGNLFANNLEVILMFAIEPEKIKSTVIPGNYYFFSGMKACLFKNSQVAYIASPTTSSSTID